MTPQQKYLLYGGIATAALYLAFFNKKAPGGSADDPTGNGEAEATGDPNVFNAFRVATDLYEAMKNWGTNEDAIIAALKTVTQPQFGQVVAKFGSLPYNDVTGDQFNAFPLTSLPRRDLPYWLKSELSDANYANLKRKYPNYL